MMAERLKFKCWNCQETYSLLRETEGARMLLVKCPFCGAEAQVDLKPYETQARTILRSGNAPESQGKSLNLPDVLPTAPREE
jgi:uncharacterized Zn finger protein